MTHTIVKKPGSVVEITVSVPWEEAAPFLVAAGKRIVTRSPVSGFRPQHTPHEVVLKSFGQDKLLEEALRAIIADSFTSVLNKETLETLGAPEVAILKCAIDNPIEYRATVAVLPKVTLPVWRELRVTRKKVGVEGAEVDQALLSLRKMQRKEEMVAREAAKDDKIVVDFDLFDKEVPLEGGQARDHAVILSEEYYLPGLPEQLVGLKKGDAKTFPITFPTSHYQKHLSGRTVECRVKVKDVFVLLVPPLDDAFAVKVGQKDVTALKQRMENNILEEKRMREEARVEEELFALVVKQTSFTSIPELLLQAEVEKMQEEMLERLAEQGIKPEAYFAHIKTTPEAFQKDLRPGATERLKVALVLREIARAEALKSEPAEALKRAAQLLKKICIVDAA